jgi:hypothetical protein
MSIISIKEQALSKENLADAMLLSCTLYLSLLKTSNLFFVNNLTFLKFNKTLPILEGTEKPVEFHRFFFFIDCFRKLCCFKEIREEVDLRFRRTLSVGQAVSPLAALRHKRSHLTACPAG